MAWVFNPFTGKLDFTNTGGGGGGTPGGSSGQVQYNNGGAFGGLSQLTFSGGKINVVSAPFGLSGNISSAAWTTSGVRYANTAATLTDTSSTGTVATAYTDLFGGNTIAASSATTFTNYYTSWFNAPTAGTNVTFTGRWALGLGGSLDIQAGTVTTNTTPALNLTQTWNAAGVAFTGLKFNATDTASASGSLLLDLQVGGTSQVRVSKAGSLTTSDITVWSNQTPGGTTSKALWSGPNSTVVIGRSGTGVAYATGNGFGFSNSTQLIWGTDESGGNGNLILTRPAAATLQLGAADAAAPVAQFFKVQSGTAGASATTVSISGTSLTIAGTVTGTIAIGHAVTGTGVSAGTLITAGSGTSWTVNNSQTVGPITAYFNSVGADFTIRGSQGSGPSTGGSLIFQVAPAGSAATTAQNAYSTALTIASDRSATFAGSVTIGTFVNLSQSNNNLLFSLNNTQSVYITNAETRINGGHSFGFTDGVATASLDTILRRDGAPNTLALRNGTNAQEFRVYGTTDGTNSEYGLVSADTGAVYFGHAKTGTGSVREIRFLNGGTVKWKIDTSGNFLANADNAVDIGASGATRPRTGYFGTSVISPTFQVGSSSNVRIISPNTNVLQLYAGNSPHFVLGINSWTFGDWSGGPGGVYACYINSSGPFNGVTNRQGDNLVLNCAGGSGNADPGAIVFRAAAPQASGPTGHSSEEGMRLRVPATGAPILSFSGITSSFPALKRSTTTLQVRLADDSAFAQLTASSLLAAGSTGVVGYSTGAGGAVTQATSRTTGVTLNKGCGQITLVSAAGSTSWQSFTVTNSTVAATDTIIVNQDSGTDLYQIFVTNVGTGTFQITFATTGGTTTEQPVFSFAVMKAVAA